MNPPYSLATACSTCHLHDDNFFCALSAESLADLNRIKQGWIVHKGEVIFAEGQSPRGVFMLCDGRAKLGTSSRDGRTFVLRIAKAGEVLGLHAVLTGDPYELTAETTACSRLTFVKREDFLRFLQDHGDASLHAAQQISRDYRDAYETVRSMALSPSTTGRVAKFLLASATSGRDRNGDLRTKFTLTHEDMAQLLGTSRETITRTLAVLRKRDIAELKDFMLIIHDKPALEHLVAA